MKKIILAGLLLTAVCMMMPYEVKAEATTQTAQDVPGVTTKTQADGTKVVTINLSEIDENKLPEKYEAKVILEAPVYELQYVKENANKLKDKIYFAIDTDSEIRQKPDVTIDNNGDIYVLDADMNRIQKFDSNGKHMKDIPFKNGKQIHFDKDADKYIADSIVTQIAVSDGNIYTRDMAKNKIEHMDKNGVVKETISIPEKIDGESTKGLKIRVLAGEVSLEKNIYNRGRKKIPIGREKILAAKNESLEKKEWIALKSTDGVLNKEWKMQNGLSSIIKSNNLIFGISDYFLDGMHNAYMYIDTGIQDESCIIKVSNKGNFLAKIFYWTYWKDKAWWDICNKTPNPLSSVLTDAHKYDFMGNIYIVQTICSNKTDMNRIQKIRIIKLSSSKNGK